MMAQRLLKHFEELVEAPRGIVKLRGLILQLAVRGMLVPQDRDDEPACALLRRVDAERQRSSAARNLRPLLSPSPEKQQPAPFTLPATWCWATLGAIASYIQRGKGPTYAERSDIPVVSQKCIQWSGFTLEPARYIDPATLSGYEAERYLRIGDLLWNSTGTGTIGRINVFDHAVVPFKTVVADSHVTVVRLLMVDPRYVWCFLAGPDVQDGFEDRASGTTNQIELSTSTVRQYAVPIAPLAEQKRIVAKVDELMALCDDLEAKQQKKRAVRITLNRACLRAVTQPNGTSLATAWHRVRDNFDDLYCVPETVAELRQTILQLAVMGRLVPQDPNDEPASEFLQRIAESESHLTAPAIDRAHGGSPFELPRGWEWTRLGNLGIECQNGLAKRDGPTGEPTIVLRLADIVRGRVTLADPRRIPLTDSERVKYALRPSDVLVTRVNGSIELVGSFTLVRVRADVAYCDHFIRMRVPHETIEPGFLELFGKSRLCRDAIEAAFITTAGQKTVNQKHIGALQIAVPPLREQKRIVARVDHLAAQCDELESRLQRTEANAETLLASVVRELVAAECGATR